MIREVTTEIRIGELRPTYLNITFRLAIDLDGVEPLSAEVWTQNGPGPRAVHASVSHPEVWWDLLCADEQDELVREVTDEIKDPADEWDFNDSGNPMMFKKWRVA
jgi:hypothetical protein